MSQADALIEWLCNDDDMTDAEIAASLAESGIDVDAFCERMKKIRDEGMKRLNDTKLKPCPFCGAPGVAYISNKIVGLPNLVSCASDDADFHNDEGVSTWCPMELSTPLCGTPEEAAFLWNDRNEDDR